MAGSGWGGGTGCNLSPKAEFSANRRKSIFCAGAAVSRGVGDAISHFSVLFSGKFCNSAISIFCAMPRYSWIRMRRSYWLQPLPIESSYLAEFSANQRKSIFCVSAAVSRGVGGAISHFSVFCRKFCNLAISVIGAGTAGSGGGGDTCCSLSL
jgi:hypothetical protein